MPPKGVTKRVTRGQSKKMPHGVFQALSPPERHRLCALNSKLSAIVSTSGPSPGESPSRAVRNDLAKNRKEQRKPSNGAKVSQRPVRSGAGGSQPSSSPLSDAPSNIPTPPGGPLPVPSKASRPSSSGEPSPGVPARILPTPRKTRNDRAVLLARKRQPAPPSRTTKQVLWDRLGKVEAEFVEQKGASAERIYNLEEALAKAKRQRSPTVAEPRSPTPSIRRTQELLDENQQLKSQIEVLEAKVAEGSSEQERTAKSLQDAAAKEKRAAQILSLSGIGATEATSPAHTSPRRSPRGSPASQAPVSSLAATPHSPKVPTPQKTQSKPDTSLPKINGRRIIQNISTPVIPQQVDDGGKLNSWPAVRAPWSKGLQNRGNDCYRNAVLQALFHIPAFYRYLGMIHKDCAFNNDQCVVCALQMLAQIYWDNKAYKQASHGHQDALLGPTVPLRDFNRACKSNPNLRLEDDFAFGSQADAAEFVAYLMEKVREMDAATFDTMFVLEEENSWTCQYCSTTHTKREPLVEGLVHVDTSQFEDETLEKEGPSEGLPLTTYIGRYFNTRQEMKCDSAQCKDSGGPGDQFIKGLPYTKRIARAPNVLAIKMQRAWSKYDPGKDLSKARPRNKIFERIDFEEYLSLGQYTTNGETVLYRLEGVVAHQGPSLDSGHYISAVRAFDGHEFQSLNDSKFLRRHWNGTMEEMRSPASERTHADFRNLDFDASPDMCFQPYILIYSRVIL